MSSEEEKERSYRRGVVLGLTMAELMLLVLFLLLILLAARLAIRSDEVTGLVHERDSLLRTVTELESRIADLETVSGFDIVDITQELVLLNDENRRMTEEIERLSPIIEIVEEREIEGPEAGEAIEELASSLSIINELESALMESGLSESSSESRQIIEDLVRDRIEAGVVDGGATSVGEELKVCLDTMSDARAQMEYLQDQCKEGGRGLVYPPCWPNADGSPQYIFDVYLAEDGIIIEDNKVPEREKDQAALPISGIRYGVPVSPLEFRSATNGLYSWSVERSCRFVVNMTDNTGDSSKDFYKDLRTAVEGSFYIRIVQ